MVKKITMIQQRSTVDSRRRRRLITSKCWSVT